ncbi:hypothetical protein HQ393_10480 [Chitinibacter bivalviorum]|uniref:Uncharacterized protein n=1 Tax=Chitinibacter bivalviorum TaxID=2739434 RepID=A0A7H9BJ14_9NEIS|nr:hypothetical protein [Chitinibacter bivalviorum]QLG88630.1 hypothetical protein HQ393_10480 [Chitinibacter bivalviorum]
MHRHILLFLLLCSAHIASASPFCPWKLPGPDAKNDRFINLTVVQFINQSDEELQISYGGGNLGSGHDIRIPTKNREEGTKILKSMLETAKQCDK